MTQTSPPALSRPTLARKLGGTVVLVATLAFGSVACNSDSGSSTAKIDAQAAADKAATERIKAQAEADKAAADRAAVQAKTKVANTAPVAAPADAAPAAAADQVDFAMPNFVGKNLQAAQDEVQTHGVFFSVSHDVLASRMQLLDANWKVCTQTPAAGTRIQGPAANYEAKFDFGSVKLSESCP